MSLTISYSLAFAFFTIIHEKIYLRFFPSLQNSSVTSISIFCQVFAHCVCKASDMIFRSIFYFGAINYNYRFSIQRISPNILYKPLTYLQEKDYANDKKRCTFPVR